MTQDEFIREVLTPKAGHDLYIIPNTHEPASCIIRKFFNPESGNGTFVEELLFISDVDMALDRYWDTRYTDVSAFFDTLSENAIVETHDASCPKALEYMDMFLYPYFGESFACIEACRCKATINMLAHQFDLSLPPLSSTP